MAELKKNQMNQMLFTMVDATDFATIESALVASDFTTKFFGVDHGGSAAMTSGAVSKAISVVPVSYTHLTLPTILLV